MATNPEFIRNFSIVAHIDHGKSTLADRILERTQTVSEREMHEQLLDSMDIERERGITIKSQAVRVKYTSEDNEVFYFNLIDTPGHVDFTYEVSRSLAACEGAILVVDATQGVEAQTVSNALLAITNDLEIVPAINKIDLPSAYPDRAKSQVEEAFAIPAQDCVEVSAKTGEGIDDLLESIVYLIPPPKGDPNAPLEALIFDSWYDGYRGVVALVRIVNGTLKTEDKVQLMQENVKFVAEEIGYKTPANKKTKDLGVGEVGYVFTGLKDPDAVKVGDTITHVENPAKSPLPGYRDIKSMVFTGLFPIDSDQYPDLRDALDKLHLNDPSLTYEPEVSQALGFGFRVGFLGLLHMEVVKERLEREFNIDLLATAPSVEYRAYLTNGELVKFKSPEDMPSPDKRISIEEPYLNVTVIVPPDFVGQVMDLTVEHRGEYQDLRYITENSAELTWKMPLSELIMDYFDKLKSRTKGFASLDYEFAGYRESDLVKLDIMLAGETVDALSFIIHRDKAYERGRAICEKLKEIIPRQMYEVPIQAAIGSRIIARETVRAQRKDVLARCYGGDVSRKKKLLEKQKEGKKRMKAIGSIEVPQEAFMAVLKIDD